MSNKKKNKKYIQAVKYYDNGELDKALKKCEESISESLKNSATLNLKGLILYQKGDIQGAVATWRINADFNEDSIAKNYIRDSKEDKKRLNFYKEGEVLLAKGLIDQAILKFEMCRVSDFNTIKVNLALANCYLKKEEYSHVEVYLTKVLSVDKNNLKALKILKELKKITGTNLQIANNKGVGKKLVGTSLAIIIVILGIYVGNTIKDSKKELNKIGEDKLIQDDNSTLEEEIKIEEKDRNLNNKIEETKEDLVDIGILEEMISSKEYDKIHEVILKTNKDKLQGKEKSLLLKAENLLKDYGVEYFYNKGMADYEKRNYEEAKTNFEKGYLYGKESYLYEHLIYFIAAIEDRNKATLEAIKYYEEYYKGYKSGSYFEEALYRLAILYQGEDLDKSIAYAEELKYNRPKSIYNNEKISDLLEKQ